LNLRTSNIKNRRGKIGRGTTSNSKKDMVIGLDRGVTFYYKGKDYPWALKSGEKRRKGGWVHREFKG